MRKLVLITALLLASAHAGESRGLVLAANDTPAATDTAAPTPAAPAATTDAPKPQADAAPAKPASAKPAKRAHRESDEAKARRIAARYGVYW